MATRLDAKELTAAVSTDAPRAAAGTGCLVGLIAFLAFIFGGATALMGAPLLPDGYLFGSVAATSVALLTAMLVARVSAAGRLSIHEPPRETLARATSFMVFGVGLGLVANSLLTHPIVHGGDHCLSCHRGEPPGAFFIAMLAGVIAAVGGPLLVSAGARIWADRDAPMTVPHAAAGGMRRPALVVRRVAWLMLLATSFAAAVGVTASRRGARLGWPEYLASLQFVGNIAAPPAPPRETGPQAPASSASALPPPAPWRRIGGDWLVAPAPQLPGEKYLLARAGFVQVGHLDDSSKAPAPGIAIESGALRAVETWGEAPAGPIVIQRDPAHGLLYLAASHDRPARGESVLPSRIALRASDGVQVAVRANDLADTLAPPLLWVVLPLIGLPMALLLLVVRPRLATLATARDRWREARADGDGALTLATGERIDWPARLPPGEVVAVLDEVGSAEGYRGPTPKLAIVVPCSRADLDSAIDLTLAARASSAIAVLLITSAPLFVLIAHGMAP